MRQDGRSLRSARTRARLLRTARTLIERRGAVEVTMSELAAASEVSRRTVYDHFGSRAGLLLALVEQADRDTGLDERLAPVLGAPSATEALDGLIEFVAEVTPPLLELASAFERARAEDPDADAAWHDRMASRLAVCSHLAARLRDEGDLRDDLTVEEAADLIYSAISWQLWQLLVSERGWSPEQWSRRVRDLLRRTLIDGRSQ